VTDDLVKGSRHHKNNSNFSVLRITAYFSLMQETHVFLLSEVMHLRQE
jgi:hypothetical protein